MKLTTNEISELLLKTSAQRLDLEAERNEITLEKRKILRKLSDADERLQSINLRLEKTKHEAAALKQQRELLVNKYDERVVERLLYRAGASLRSIQGRIKHLTPDEIRTMEDIERMFSRTESAVPGAMAAQPTTAKG